jgi:hypothetical protein
MGRHSGRRGSLVRLPFGLIKGRGKRVRFAAAALDLITVTMAALPLTGRGIQRSMGLLYEASVPRPKSLAALHMALGEDYPHATRREVCRCPDSSTGVG